MQLARLGDLVQTWPLLARLKGAWPQCRVDVLCDASLAPLARQHPAVNEAVELKWGAWAALTPHDPVRACRLAAGQAAALRNRGYELVFNLNFSRLSLLLGYLTGAPLRGYQPVQGGREFGRPPWLAYIFALAHARSLNQVHISDVFRHLGPPVRHEEPLFPSPARRGGELRLALQLATRHPKRTWPRSSFADLARRLVGGLGARLVLLGTEAERPSGEWLIRALPASHRQRLVNLMGRTSLPELAAELRQANLLVSGDTGTLHLAASLGVRTLGLFFGPAHCLETGPYGPGHAVLQAEPPCHPCAETSPCPDPVCARMITPEAVAQAAADLVEGEIGEVASLPAGVRLYESARDWLGAAYRVRQGAPAGLRQALGKAYRRAAAPLLGLTPPPVAGEPELPTHLKHFLARLAAAGRRLGSDSDPADSPALVPLLAFRAELLRQAAWQGMAEAWRTRWLEVVEAFVSQLEAWAA
jgi:ADP-heptose:LPS heptosyltransferase